MVESSGAEVTAKLRKLTFVKFRAFSWFTIVLATVQTVTLSDIRRATTSIANVVNNFFQW